MMSSKYDGKAGLGFYLGLLCVCTMIFTVIFSLRKDPAGKKHKAVVWYNGLSKIILLICLPLAVAMVVLSVMMIELLHNLPIFTSIGVFLIVAGTVIAAAVAVFTELGKYKSGLLYFITGACWAVGILFCMSKAGFGAFFVAVAFAVLSALFWMSLGLISQKYF